MTTRLGLAAVAALLGAAAGCNQILGTTPPLPPCGSADWTHWIPTATHTYDPTQGSDGNRYVTDELTGLAWPTPAPTSAVTWDDAGKRCAGLAWGGLQGYRLPTLVELASLTRYDLPPPALDPTAFPGAGGDFWTSTPAAGFDGSAFVVSHGDGRFGPRNKGATAGAWCVHDLKQAPDKECVRYAFDDGEASVRDVETDLVWQRAESSGMKSWADAEAACAALPIGGHAFRLPEVSELVTLLDVRGGSPSGLDPQFFGAGEPGDFHWTATADAVGPSTGAWDVDTGSGMTAPGLSSQAFHVRCVR